jgi:hypothetical protein
LTVSVNLPHSAHNRLWPFDRKSRRRWEIHRIEESKEEMKKVWCLAVTVCLVLSCGLFAQQNAVSAPPSGSSSVTDHIGMGVKVGLLGAGAEIAARIESHSNVRAGFNVLGYSRGFDKDGINYSGHLSFRTIEAHYDYYPWAGKFHISGGLLDYIGNPITANALIPVQSSFSLGGQQYYTQSNQAFASGKVKFNQVSPTITFGWGNLVRENHHFSFPVELGVAFQGSPKSALGVGGTICTDPVNPATCVNAATDATVQSNVVAEQAKLDKNMKPFKFFPIISFGFGYKF